jgi:hypothetical protein
MKINDNQWDTKKTKETSVGFFYTHFGEKGLKVFF